jgi:hypothetical protein
MEDDGNHEVNDYSWLLSDASLLTYFILTLTGTYQQSVNVSA